LWARAAAAQPCAGYREHPIEALREGLAAKQLAAAQMAEDTNAKPSQRLRGFVALARVADEMRGAYSICSVPAKADDDWFRSETGWKLSEADAMREDAYRRCRTLVAQVHAAGPEARACLDAAHRPGYLTPAPPAAWSAADADASAALAAQTKRPLDIAAIALASHDWNDVLATVASGYDADLLRGAALDGLDRTDEAERVFRRLIRRSPERREAHFDLAMLVISHIYDGDWATPRRVRSAFEHARIFLCLLDGADPELADDGTGLLRQLEEHRTGSSAWFWHSDQTQPPLPLPLRTLGPEARSLFEPTHRAATTCAAVLRDNRRESSP
jgi:hypothetical protein